MWTYHGPVPMGCWLRWACPHRGLGDEELASARSRVRRRGHLLGRHRAQSHDEPAGYLEWPYSVYVCEPEEGSIFGLSMPYLDAPPPEDQSSTSALASHC